MTDAIDAAWRDYLAVCREARENGTYDRVEPFAWERLQRVLDRARPAAKVAA